MKEIRVMAELRAETAADGSGMVLTGRPIVFNAPATINDYGGSYTEIIRSGALNDTDISDIRLLYNHDLDRIPLARTPKTLKVTVDEQGLNFTAELAQTESAKEVYAAVKRGDLSGMSFAFKVAEGGDRYEAETNTRNIYNIQKIYECSIVPFPAYPQTSVEARAAMLASKDALKQRQAAKILINQILKQEV